MIMTKCYNNNDNDNYDNHNDDNDYIDDNEDYVDDNDGDNKNFSYPHLLT